LNRYPGIIWPVGRKEIEIEYGRTLKNGSREESCIFHTL